MIVAIFVRCAFDELVRMENSTWSPCGSTREPSLLQEKPAASGALSHGPASAADARCFRPTIIYFRELPDPRLASRGRYRPGARFLRGQSPRKRLGGSADPETRPAFW